jgi:glycosyltransferase involved in cell wall biosynthesis
VIRVLHVITRLTMGGSSENTVGQVLALGRAGFDCRLAAGLGESEPATVEDARRRGCEILDVPGLGREVSPLRDLAALARLGVLIRRRRPAVLHTHTSKAGFLGRLAARLTGVPAVIHQPHGHVFYGYWGARRTALYVALERLAARWTDRIVTLTERGTEEHLARGIGRPAQFVTVPSGVPVEVLAALAPERAEARARLGLPPDAFVVIGVGRLVRVKGFDVLLASWPRLVAAVPGALVVLVGDGPERPALASQAAALGIVDRVRFVGPVGGGPGALAALLAAADVCAAPSRNEGMGRSLVEAMALGVPVVASAVGGIPAVVGDDEVGRLVPPDDAEALAAALLELAEDRALRAKLGEAARVRARRFSTAMAEARMLALYAGLLRAKGLG